MSGLRALGSLADGIAQGMVLGREIKARDMSLERARKADADAAEMEADLKAANEAAQRAYKELETKHTQQYRGADAGMRYGGSDGSLTDAGVARLEQPVPTFRLDPNQLLRVAEVRTDELMKRGRYDQARKLWEQDEGMRRQLREDALRKHYRAFKAGGDPTPLIKGVYDNVDDNWDLGEVIQGPETHGGDRIFGVTRVNRVTGEKKTDELRAADIEEALMEAMDPKRADDYAWRQKLIDYQSKTERGTAEAKHKLTLAEIAARGENAMDQIGARTEGMLEGKRIQVQGTITAAQIRASAAKGGGGGGRGGGASGVQSKQVLDDGRVMLVMRDGTNRIMTDEAGKPVRSIDAERLLAGVTRDVGKTLGGSMQDYGGQQATARAALPQAPAPRPSLDGFVRQPAPAQKPAAKPPIDSFFQR